MRRVYQVAAVFFLLVAAVLGYHAVALRYYTPLGPGPGFFPVWLCALLGALALFVFLQTSIEERSSVPEDFFAPRSGYVRIVAVLVGLFAFAFLLPVLGFRLAMLLFYVALLALLGRRSLLETMVLAVLGSFGAYYVFVEFLSRPLPVGIFGI